MTVGFLRPTTLAAAFDALDLDGAVVLAGGQSVVVLMNTGLLQPERLVAVTGIEELRGIHVDVDGTLDIGALSTLADASGHAQLREAHPELARTFGMVGNVRVRGRGTLGGNLAHADPAQDPPVALAALDAEAIVVGPTGERTVPTSDLALGPFTPAIEDGELISRIRVPALPPGAVMRYEKFRAGSQDDYATVSVAANLRFDDNGLVTAAALHAGSVGPTVVDLDRAVGHLIGQDVMDPDVLTTVHERVRELVAPVTDRRGSADYKREMAGVVSTRAIQRCVNARTGHRGGDR